MKDWTPSLSASFSSLWSFDGRNVTEEVRFGPGFDLSSDLVVYGDALYFANDDGLNGNELWRFTPQTFEEGAFDVNKGSGS